MTAPAALVLRAGASAVRSAVDGDAWAVPLVAALLDADADRVDRGEPVGGLDEGLALAREFLETVPAGPFLDGATSCPIGADLDWHQVDVDCGYLCCTRCRTHHRHPELCDGTP